LNIYFRVYRFLLYNSYKDFLGLFCMRKELREFVLDNELGIFDSGGSVRSLKCSFFGTKDVRDIYRRVLGRLSSFVFDDSVRVWNFFGMDVDSKEIFRRQEFFRGVSSSKLVVDSILKKLERPRKSWAPKYDVVVVTESEESFVKLNKLACGVVLISSQNDVADLERYDVVQCVDCEEYRGILERLPQSVFLSSLEDAYLERFLEELSSWRANFALLNGVDVSRELRDVLDELIEPFALLENKEGRVLTEGEVEQALEDINEDVSESIKDKMISGADMMRMLGEGKMGNELLEIVRGSIEATGLPEHIFNIGIPVSIDYKELEEQIRLQSANEYTDVAERIKRNASRLKGIPEILRRLEAEILIEDFCCGVVDSVFGGCDSTSVKKTIFPKVGEELLLEDCENLFLKNPQPVSFILDNENRGSILTGANSGGKTTLLEHVLQNVVLMKLGLGVVGNFRSPNFNRVYYFAKNKGSASKGAFETLLMQLSQVEDSGKTLVLADEIEAVTEPGVAGKIIGATVEYFVERKIYVVMATHLGAEVSKVLPEYVRIDGIEARGLDEDFNLIVNHNPVLGRLASSTPELIVERMARSNESEYFEFLFGKMKGDIIL
jgi:DNA mismatch repair protein MutS2